MNLGHTDEPKNNDKRWVPQDYDPNRPNSSRVRQRVVVQLANAISARERDFPNVQMTSALQEHGPTRKRVGDRQTLHLKF